MSGYYNLKQNIMRAIKDNGQKEITGQTLQTALVDMINSMGAHFQLAGIATPSTNPGDVDASVFYLASTPGTYANFNNLEVNENELAALYKGASGVWYKWSICSISGTGQSGIENNSIGTAMLKDKSITNAKIANYAISANHLDAALYNILSGIGLNGASFLGIISSADYTPKKGSIDRVTGQISYDYNATGFYILDFSKFSDVENGQYVVLNNFNGGGLWDVPLRVKKNEGDIAAVIANGAFGTANSEFVDLFHFNANIGSLALTDGSITTAKLADKAVTLSKLGHDVNAQLSRISEQYCYEGIVVTGSSVPGGVGNAFVIAQQDGIYTNFKDLNGDYLTVSSKNSDYSNYIAIFKTGNSDRTYWKIEYINVRVTSSGTGSGSGEIADGSITTAKLADGIVTTNKLANDVKTQIKKIDEQYCYEGIVVTGSSAPGGVGNAFVIAQQDGIYTNFKDSSGNSLVVSSANANYSDYIAIFKTVNSNRMHWEVEYINVRVTSSGGSGTVTDGSITTAKLANSSVTADKIENLAVTNTKIANYAVTLAKLSSDVQTEINSITNYLPLAGGTMSGNIVTPTDDNLGIRPSANNYGQIGDSSYHFYRGYINNLYIGSNSRIYESSDYLTINSSSGVNIENNLGVTGTINCDNDVTVKKLKIPVNYSGSGSTAYCEIYGDAASDQLVIDTNAVNINKGYLFVSKEVYAPSFNQTSDYRLKNILEENIALPLDIIADAPSIRYNLKNDKKETTHLGTIAQYWANVTGEDIAKKNSEGYYSIESANLGITMGISLAKHLREANNKIALLEERLKTLEDKLNI